MNEEDENRIAVLNRDTGEVSVWELTIQKEYDITEVVAYGKFAFLFASEMGLESFF